MIVFFLQQFSCIFKKLFWSVKKIGSLNKSFISHLCSFFLPILANKMKKHCNFSDSFHYILIFIFSYTYRKLLFCWNILCFIFIEIKKMVTETIHIALKIETTYMPHDTFHIVHRKIVAKTYLHVPKGVIIHVTVPHDIVSRANKMELSSGITKCTISHTWRAVDNVGRSFSHSGRHGMLDRNNSSRGWYLYKKVICLSAYLYNCGAFYSSWEAMR